MWVIISATPWGSVAEFIVTEESSHQKVEARRQAISFCAAARALTSCHERAADARIRVVFLVAGHSLWELRNPSKIGRRGHGRGIPCQRHPPRPRSRH